MVAITYHNSDDYHHNETIEQDTDMIVYPV